MAGLRRGSLDGVEVRRRRIAIGWSREQLAAYVGVPATEVAQWESGDHEIELTVAVRFALETGEAERRDQVGLPHRSAGRVARFGIDRREPGGEDAARPAGEDAGAPHR